MGELSSEIRNSIISCQYLSILVLEILNPSREANKQPDFKKSCCVANVLNKMLKTILKNRVTNFGHF